MENPKPDDSGVLPENAPDDGSRSSPRNAPPANPQVTPLDEDENLEKGIEIHET